MQISVWTHFTFFCSFDTQIARKCHSCIGNLLEVVFVGVIFPRHRYLEIPGVCGCCCCWWSGLYCDTVPASWTQLLDIRGAAVSNNCTTLNLISRLWLIYSLTGQLNFHFKIGHGNKNVRKKILALRLLVFPILSFRYEPLFRPCGPFLVSCLVFSCWSRWRGHGARGV